MASAAVAVDTKSNTCNSASSGDGGADVAALTASFKYQSKHILCMSQDYSFHDVHYLVRKYKYCPVAHARSLFTPGSMYDAELN